jgi:hypothetical protein
MAYHSQQVLLMRHEQEKYLDSVLKNRNKNNTILEEDIVKNTQEKNILISVFSGSSQVKRYFVNSIQGLIFAIRTTPMLIMLSCSSVKLLSFCGLMSLTPQLKQLKTIRSSMMVLLMNALKN